MPDLMKMSPLRALKAVFSAFVVPGVFFLIPAAHASTSDVTDLMNRLRSVPSKCAGTPGLEKLVRRAELDHAASLLAGGASLKDSTKGSGYQSLGLQGISMSGSTNIGALEQLLANGYCPLIVDPKLVDVGVHQHGNTTWVLLAPAFVPAGGRDDGGISRLMVTLVNDARANGRKCGGTFYPPVGPVVSNDLLTRAARAHSEDMGRHNFFSHTSRDGTSAADRVERVGYDYRSTAENIAAGQMSAEAAMAAWLASPGHCANLMDAAFNEMGVALYSNRQTQLGAYWTQVFGVRRAARAVKGARPASPI
jgi:uncharacterized protein YkwD